MLSPSLLDRLGDFCSRVANGEEALWKVWWVTGIPLGWLAGSLVITAEESRYAGYHGWGDFLDLVRFLIYFAWLRVAWRCSRNVERPIWTPVVRATLASGLVFMAMF